MDASASARSVALASLTAKIKLTGAPWARGTATAALLTKKVLVGALVGRATATAALTAKIKLAGAAAGQASATAAVTTKKTLAAKAYVVATGSAVLRVGVKFKASSLCPAKAQAWMTLVDPATTLYIPLGNRELTLLAEVRTLTI